MAQSRSPHPTANLLLATVGLGTAGISTGLALSYPLITNQHFTKSVQTRGTKPLSTAQRLSLWWHSYTHGYCVPLSALISSISLGSLYVLNRRSPMLSTQRKNVVGGAIAGQFLIIPFTLAFIMPVNKRLHALLQSANSGVPVSDDEVDSLFAKWTRLHLARVASLAVACGAAIMAFTS